MGRVHIIQSKESREIVAVIRGFECYSIIDEETIIIPVMSWEDIV